MFKCNVPLLLLLFLLLAACNNVESQSTDGDAVVSDATDHDDHDEDDTDHGETHEDHDGETEHADDDHADGGDLMLPELAAIRLDGRRLNVVATTSIVGDVVGNIGGAQIDLTVLMEKGEDPHTYQTTPQDFAAMEAADVIFVNGWDLEERLAIDIEDNFSEKMVAISAGIEPLPFGGEDKHGDADHADEEEHHDDADEDNAHAAHAHGNADPHVWFSIHHVERWASNASQVLGGLDPANAADFETNSAEYIHQLEALEVEIEDMLAKLPAESRQLVTNHDSLSYFASEYGFEVVGTVLPGASTSAEPSAMELGELVMTMEQAGVCTIFGETTASNQLAETVSAELSNCESVQVLTIYTGSLGEGDASTYIGMFRSTVQTIIAGLE